jgi:hypothetical protein
MPYPLTHSYGIPILIQPVFCQQLGIFSSCNLDKDIITEFYSYLRKPFPVQYNINSSFVPNEYTEYKYDLLPNIELNLNHVYTDLYENYLKNTRRNIVKAKKSGMVVEKIIPDNYILKQHFQNLRFRFNNKKMDLFSRIIKHVNTDGTGHTWICNSGGSVIAIAFFVLFQNRLTFIGSSSTQTGYDKSAVFYLFDNVIKEYSNRNIILDFEGSKNKGVARFYKGFGGKNKSYFQISNKSLLFYKMMQKIL